MMAMNNILLFLPLLLLALGGFSLLVSWQLLVQSGREHFSLYSKISDTQNTECLFRGRRNCDTNMMIYPAKLTLVKTIFGTWKTYLTPTSDGIHQQAAALLRDNNNNREG